MKANKKNLENKVDISTSNIALATAGVGFSALLFAVGSIYSISAVNNINGDYPTQIEYNNEIHYLSSLPDNRAYPSRIKFESETGKEVWCDFSKLQDESLCYELK